MTYFESAWIRWQAEGRWHRWVGSSRDIAACWSCRTATTPAVRMCDHSASASRFQVIVERIDGGSRPGPEEPRLPTFCPPPVFPPTTYYCPPTRRSGARPQNILARTATSDVMRSYGWVNYSFANMTSYIVFRIMLCSGVDKFFPLFKGKDTSSWRKADRNCKINRKSEDC